MFVMSADFLVFGKAHSPAHLGFGGKPALITNSTAGAFSGEYPPTSWTGIPSAPPRRAMNSPTPTPRRPATHLPPALAGSTTSQNRQPSTGN
jgi:hypothetical protein